MITTVYNKLVLRNSIQQLKTPVAEYFGLNSKTAREGNYDRYLTLWESLTVEGGMRNMRLIRSQISIELLRSINGEIPR